jgi:NADH-quinone oxidoreductase subunit L
VRCADEYIIFNVLFPLIGFILLAAGRNKLPENVAAIIGVGSVGLSALFALIAGLDFVKQWSTVFVQHLWTWFNVGGFAQALAYILMACHY